MIERYRKDVPGSMAEILRVRAGKIHGKYPKTTVGSQGFMDFIYGLLHIYIVNCSNVSQ